MAGTITKWQLISTNFSVIQTHQRHRQRERDRETRAYLMWAVRCEEYSIQWKSYQDGQIGRDQDQVWGTLESIHKFSLIFYHLLFHLTNVGILATVNTLRQELCACSCQQCTLVPKHRGQ